MKNRRWLRQNWLLVAALSLFGIHSVTYLMQKFVKKSTQFHSELKKKSDDN
ncbi:uncharacterized protein [Narcine bancroftii]|uniref:uncharacterized protein n=1 Tax=Narcine bancroftii TaxID=1343680 RepID=UPI00383125FA